MKPRMPPSIPPAKTENIGLGRDRSRIARSKKRTFRITQTIPASGTQTKTGRDVKDLRDEDTGPIAVDIPTSAGSLTLYTSDAHEANVSRHLSCTAAVVKCRMSA